MTAFVWDIHAVSFVFSLSIITCEKKIK